MPVKGALGTSTKKIQSITCLLCPSVGFKQQFYGISCDIIIQLFFQSSAGRYPKLASWILLDPRIGYLQVSPSFFMIYRSIEYIWVYGLYTYEYMDCIHDTDPPRKTDTFRQVINPSTQHSQHPARGERLENADLLHHQHHRLADVDLGASASDFLLLQRCLVRKVGIGKRNDRCVCVYVYYI